MIYESYVSNSHIGSGFDPDYEVHVIKIFLIIEQDVKNMQFSVCSTSQNHLNAHCLNSYPVPRIVVVSVENA